MRFFLSIVLFFGTIFVSAQDDQIIQDSIYVVADEGPYLSNCYTDSISTKELKDCSQKIFLDYFFRYLRFPKKAIKKKQGGMAVCSFVINKDGSISDIAVVKDPGLDMGKAALETLELIHKDVEWIPAKDDGEPVRFRYMLPVRFNFE